MNKDNSLRIPKSKNNGDLKLEQLNEDQFNVAYVIFDKVREWINLKSASSQVKKKFKPLWLTVLGCGGTGKSLLINTIVAQIRTIFKNNNSVLVTAPTGAAAHNVGGQTIHREFKISVKKKKGSSLANSAKEHLIQKLSQTIALFFDEWSMISQRVIRSAEINVRTAAHGGEHSNED
jgi:phage gpG-like protein